MIVDISHVWKSAYCSLTNNKIANFECDSAVLHLMLYMSQNCLYFLSAVQRETKMTSAKDCTKICHMNSVLIDMIASPRQTSFLKHWGVQKKSLLWACDQIVRLFPASVWPVISCMLFCTQLSIYDLAWLQTRYLSSLDVNLALAWGSLTIELIASWRKKSWEIFFIEIYWSYDKDHHQLLLLRILLKASHRVWKMRFN